jgi:hypothetical protein
MLTYMVLGTGLIMYTYFRKGLILSLVAVLCCIHTIFLLYTLFHMFMEIN